MLILRQSQPQALNNTCPLYFLKRKILVPYIPTNEKTGTYVSVFPLFILR